MVRLSLTVVLWGAPKSNCWAKGGLTIMVRGAAVAAYDYCSRHSSSQK